jgi:hypothetical protein
MHEGRYGGELESEVDAPPSMKNGHERAHDMESRNIQASALHIDEWDSNIRGYWKSNWDIAPRKEIWRLHVGNMKLQDGELRGKIRVAKVRSV